MLSFRPLPVLSVLSLAALALLLTLGSWQLQRMAWKSHLVEGFEQRGRVDTLAAALCDQADADYSPAIDTIDVSDGATLRYYGLRDGPGWIRLGQVEAPACFTDGAPVYLLAETGFERLDAGSSPAPVAWRLERWAPAGTFSGRNDPDTNQWYSFDRSAMAAALGLDTAQLSDLWLRADDGLPASLTQTPPARHLGYALTWFGLAAALVGVYLAFHRARGRLAWKGRGEAGDKQE
ncbi:SURF1 family protein [Maricaulis sp. CAU 1757]